MTIIYLIMLCLFSKLSNALLNFSVVHVMDISKYRNDETLKKSIELKALKLEGLECRINSTLGVATATDIST